MIPIVFIPLQTYAMAFDFQRTNIVILSGNWKECFAQRLDIIVK